MKKILIAAGFCIAAVLSQAQSLAVEVISSGGEFAVSPTHSLSWTLGETMTETYVQGFGIFTQGFQQPSPNSITGLEDEEKILSVYPNPVRDFLFVKTSEDGDYQFELMNMQGQRILEVRALGIMGTHIQQFEISDLKTALYLLRVTHMTTGKCFIHKIEKL